MQAPFCPRQMQCDENENWDGMHDPLSDDRREACFLEIENPMQKGWKQASYGRYGSLTKGCESLVKVNAASSRIGKGPPVGNLRETE